MSCSGYLATNSVVTGDDLTLKEIFGLLDETREMLDACWKQIEENKNAGQSSAAESEGANK